MDTLIALTWIGVGIVAFIVVAAVGLAWLLSRTFDDDDDNTDL